MVSARRIVGVILFVLGLLGSISMGSVIFYYRYGGPSYLILFVMGLLVCMIGLILIVLQTKKRGKSP